jgi:hypothetical protein
LHVLIELKNSQESFEMWIKIFKKQIGNGKWKKLVKKKIVTKD